MLKWLIACLVWIVALMWASWAWSAEVIDVQRLADAIHKAEGNDNYGVLSVPCVKGEGCRKVCINSIRNNLKRYERSDKSLDFISFMGARWCPVGAKNDPMGLNKNWIGNVRKIYNSKTL